MEYSPPGLANVGMLLLLQGTVAEIFLYICFLGLLASVRGGS